MRPSAASRPRRSKVRRARSRRKARRPPEQCTVRTTPGTARAASRNGWYADRAASRMTESKFPAGWWLWTPKRKRRASLTVDVPVPHHGRQARALEGAPKQLHEGHRAVAASGAPESDRQVGLALPAVERQEEAQQILDLRQQLAAFLEGRHELLHRGVAAVEALEGVHEVRIRQEADVEDEVGVVGRPVFEAEGHKRNPQHITP